MVSERLWIGVRGPGCSRSVRAREHFRSAPIACDDVTILLGVKRGILEPP